MNRSPSPNSMSRRGFLRGSLATAALAPFAIHGLARSARAASPMKVLFVYVPDGCIPSQWHPRGSETGFTLSAMTEPLVKIRQHLVFLDGIDMYAGGATHEGGIAKMLTGTGALSLDVFLGQTVGADLPHKSVHLGVGANFQNGSGSMSFIGAGQEVKPDDDPLNAFDRLFGVSAGGAGGGSGSSAAERRRQRRAAILDTALMDLEQLRRRAGAPQAQKLETHQSALEEVRRRVTGAAAGGGTIGCANPVWNREGFANNPMDYYPKTYEREEHFGRVGKLQMDLAVLALSCGLTRVASLMWSHAVSPTRIPETGVSLGNHDASHYGTEGSATAESFITLKRWFMERFAYLIEELANRPDGTGSGTLLDSTLVLLCSELGDGNLHDHRRVPFILAGGGLKGNRYLDYRGRGMGGENEPHTKLLVSIARRMGSTIDRFGYTGHGTGGLEGLT